MVHRDTQELAAAIDEYGAAEHEYFIGIRDQMVFEPDNPEEASILAITRNPVP